MCLYFQVKTEMLFRRCFSVMLLCTLCYDTVGKMVSITKNPTGREGSNATSIECIVNLDGIGRIREVSIYAFINETMTVIITYHDYGATVISSTGKYLGGRVTYNSISGISNRTILQFNTVLCEDDTDYQCQLLYVPDPPGPSVTAVSELSHLIVKVLPSRPKYIKVMTVNSIKNNMNNENEKRNLVFVEGDNISVTCAGDVGKPPRNLTMHKIQRNGMAYLMSGNRPVNEGVPNCSFYQNNSFSTLLTEEDNGSVLRCAVEGFMDDDNMYIQTSQLVILYPVRIPDIHVYPGMSTMPPVTLHCIVKGNPVPQFKWFKLSNISQTNRSEFYASTPVITLTSASDAGVYRCDVYNSIGQNVYRNSSNVTVNFEGIPNTDIRFVTDKPCNFVPAALGGVFGSLGICLIVLAIVFIWKTRRNKGNGCPKTTVPDQGLSSHYEEISRGQTANHTDAALSLSSNYEGVSCERTNHEYTEIRNMNKRISNKS